MGSPHAPIHLDRFESGPLFQKDRDKKFARLGSAFSAVTILLLLAGYVALLYIYGIW